MDQMNRLLRGLPAEPAPDDSTEQAAPTSGRDWFDRVVLGRPAVEPDDEPTTAA
jgi:hypothetical protein